MRNTKMKFKIFFLTILFLISLNNVSADNYENGTLTKSIYGDSSRSLISSVSSFNFGAATTSLFNWKVTDTGKTGTPTTMKYTNIKSTYKGEWIDVPQFTGGTFLIGTNGECGTGMFYIQKLSADRLVNIHFLFDENYDCPTGTHVIKIYSSRIYDYYTSIGVHGATPDDVDDYTDQFGCAVVYGTASLIGEFTGYSGTVTYENMGLFINDYSIYSDYSFGETVITRNIAEAALKSSSFIIKNESGIETFNSGYSSSNATYNHINESAYYYLKINANQEEYLIYSSVYITPELEIPELSFNQSIYYINDTMEYEYSYLNKLYTTNKYYDLVFYYYTNEDTIEYLYIQPLSDYDNTGYLSTYGWSPKKLYYGIIDNSLNYRTSKTLFLNNVKLSDYMILTYEDEFIHISCEGDNCQYENGDSFIITYNTHSNYTLNVKDNSTSIVQSLGNINGFGTISYTIPYDNGKQYSYPYWNISFNESYETIIVFWSIEEEIISYEDEPINESIQANVDEIKEGVKPLFDLAFGLSTIIVDNPDYDNNGVTSSSELDRWFNSIISIVILLALYIFYKGLKDRGSK